MYCQKCGNEIPDNSVFCDVCGERVSLQVGTQQTVQKDVEKKKRNKSTIILSVFLCLSLIGCGVLGYIVADQASFITSRKQIIQNYRDELDKCIPKAEFLDNKVVIVGGTSTKTYHKYGCVLLDTTNGYLAFNPENAKANGYKPCSICCK